MPRAQPMAGSGPSQLADQTVVATTTTHGGLRPELITGDLERPCGCSNPATHQPWIEPEGNAQGGQPALHLLKTLTAGLD
jgi:hypothetical protein